MGNAIIADTTVTIDEFAFDGCDKLYGDVILPKGVEVVGARAFSSCGFDGTLYVPKSVNR